MRLNRYTNQDVQYTPFAEGRDPYGERTMGTTRTIKGRKEEKQNVVRNQYGAELLSSAVVLTIEEIQLGELLDGLEVQARENYVDRRGNVVGWRSYL